MALFGVLLTFGFAVSAGHRAAESVAHSVTHWLLSGSTGGLFSSAG